MSPIEVSEAKLVNDLRQAVDNPENIDDSELKRFLRARNYDIEKAAGMLRKSILWKIDTKYDEALTWKISETVRTAFPYYIDGIDKDGRTALYFPIGRWEVRQMLAVGCKNDMERYIYTSMANVVKTLDASKYEDFVIIIDLAELTYWKIAHFETMQLVLKVFNEYEQNFPERLHSAIVINAPWVLNVIFPVIKPLLTGKTLQKVQIFDSSPDKYFPAILDVIPIDGLPSGFQEYNREMIQSRITDNSEQDYINSVQP